MRQLPPIAAQAHREQLASLPLIDELAKILTVLAIGYSPVYARPSVDALVKDVVRDKPPIVKWQKVTRDDIARYSLLLKTTEALLRKVLPDLKSIEIMDNQQTQRSLTDAELAQRIAGVLNVAKPSLNGSDLNPRNLN